MSPGDVAHSLVRCRRCHGWTPTVGVRAIAAGAACPNCGTPLPLSVLIADSNAQLAAVMAQLLADEPGFCVIGVVHDAAAAVITAQQSRPDLVLVDRELGQVPGRTVCSALRATAPESVLLLWAHDPQRPADACADVDSVIERGMTYRELVLEMTRTVRRTYGGAPSGDTGAG